MGLARQISVSLVGRQIDVIPHTGVLVHGEEHFFSGGLQALPPHRVQATFGLAPIERISLGRTRRSREELRAFLNSVEDRYRAEHYDLFRHNCNHFSDEVLRFLGAGGVPERIMSVPEQVLSTPMGAQLATMFGGGISARRGIGGGNDGSVGFDPFAAAAANGGNPLAAMAAAFGGSASSGGAVTGLASAEASQAAARRVVAALAGKSAPILTSHSAPMLAEEASGRASDLTARLLRASDALPADSPKRLTAGEAAALNSLPAALAVVSGSSAGTAAVLPALAKALRSWPVSASAVPALALLRVLVTRGDCAAALTAGAREASGDARGLLWDVLETVAAPEGAPWYGGFAASVLALAVLGNAFGTSLGAAWAASPAALPLIVDALSRVFAAPPAAAEADASAAPAAGRPELRRAAAAVAYNLANAMPVGADAPATAGGPPLVTDAAVQLLGALLDTLPAETDSETQRRRILAAGRVILREGSAAAELIAVLGMGDALQRVTDDSNTQTAVKVLADEVLRLLSPEATE